MHQFLKKVEWLEETIIAYLLLAMVAISFVNVVLRRLFDSGLFWSLEAVLFMFLVFVMFGMSYAARKSLHVGIDIIVNLFDQKIKKYIAVVACIISCIYAFAIAYAAYGVFNKYYNIPALRRVFLEDIPVPVWFVYAFMSASFTYLLLTLLFCCYEIIMDKRDGITSAHEEDNDK